MHSPLHLRRRQAASTLVLVIFVVTLLVVFIGLALDYSAGTARMTMRGADYTRAQALANGALEVAYRRWSVYMVSKQGSPIQVYTKTSDFQTSAVPASVLTQVNSAANAVGFTVSELSLVSVDRADNVPPAPGNQTASFASAAPVANVPGWTATTFTYRARAVVTKTADPSLTVSVSRYFQQADESLFQAMLFFQDDLELHPGPAMTLFGLVHTNRNFYAAAGSSGSLTFSSSVSYTGATPLPADPNNHLLTPASNYKYEDPRGYVEGVTQTLYNQETSNWVNFNAPAYPNTRATQLSQVQALYPLGNDESEVPDPTNPGNASGTHEIIERPVPNSATDPSANLSIPDPAATSAHRIYNSAGLRIFINHTTAYTSTGGGAPSKVHVYYPSDPLNPGTSTEIVPTVPPAAPNIANQIVAAITPSSGGEITDFREGHTVNLDTVDMSVLTPALNGYPSYNGVVYISDITSADANGNTGNSDAIRVKKGGVLPDGGVAGNGFTLATDGAVYVQGDYNTGVTYNATDGAGGLVVPLKGLPVSDTGADTTPPTVLAYTIPPYTQKPAAVMGDAVMILSNSWVDSESILASSKRIASPTTVNAAIVSGAVVTTSSAASGGAHNFPRFLEDWSGMNFTYHGSMAELYRSIHFTGTYGKGNVYSPPNRRWFFDSNFLTTPPPGNLRTTTYARGRWIRNANS